MDGMWSWRMGPEKCCLLVAGSNLKAENLVLERLNNVLKLGKSVQVLPKSILYLYPGVKDDRKMQYRCFSIINIECPSDQSPPNQSAFYFGSERRL